MCEIGPEESRAQRWIAFMTTRGGIMRPRGLCLDEGFLEFDELVGLLVPSTLPGSL